MNKNKKGFTLVEIIIVLVVIVILSAIAIPTFAGYIHKAKESSAISECREVVQASQTVATRLYSEDKLSTGNVLMLSGNKNEIISLSETEGLILNIAFDRGSDKVLKLSYLATNDYMVYYNAMVEPNYSIDEVIDSAPDYDGLSEGLLADSEILSTVNERDKQTQALQKAFLEENDDIYPQFSTSEQQMMLDLNYSSPQNLNWRPMISANGDVFLAGSTADTTKANPLSSVLYYNGNYYYWSHLNVVKTAYVSDASFDVSKLDSTKTTLDADDKNGAWLVYDDTNP